MTTLTTKINDFLKLEQNISSDEELWSHHVQTALVFCGVNSPDHAQMYNRITDLVSKENGSVAIVKAGSSTESSKSLTSSIVKQLIQNYYQNKKGDADFSGPFTFYGLADWYDKTFPVVKPVISNSNSGSNITPAGVDMATNLEHRRMRTRRPTVNPTAVVNTTTPSKRKSVKRLSLPLQPVNTSPPKARRLNVSGPLVIILTRVEAVSSEVLRDLVHLVSHYASSETTDRPLPIKLVLGVSTSEPNLTRRLDTSTLARLELTRFTLASPKHIIDSVLSELIHYPGFHLDRSAITYLLDNLFLCLDYSVRNFIRRVKFCMLQHYLALPYPELLRHPGEVADFLYSLSAKQMASLASQCFTSLSSVVLGESGLSSLSSPASISSKKSPAKSRATHLISWMVATLDRHWTLQLLAPHLLGCLQPIVARLAGGSPIGRTVNELYRFWLDKGFAQPKEFTSTIRLLGSLPKSTLIEAIRVGRQSLQTSIFQMDQLINDSDQMWPCSTIVTCKDQLEQLIESLDQWILQLQEASDIAEPKTPTANRPRVTNSPFRMPQSPVIGATSGETGGGLNRPRKMSIRELRQQLSEMSAAASSSSPSSSQNATQSQWDRRRQAFFVWFVQQLVTLLPQPNTLPLHEVFYGPSPKVPLSSGTNNSVESARMLRLHLNPCLLTRLHNVLTDPGKHLQVNAYALESADCLSSNLPDLSIIYKLHLESGRMINVYDWLMAFATVIGESADMDNPPSQLVQTRFLHGVAQLCHMGYIKSTRRRADHVVRLVASFFN